MSVSDLDDLYKISRYSDQIFSCSALRFADELYPTPDELASIGDLVSSKWSNIKIMGKIRCSSDRSAGPFMEFEKIKMTKSIKGKHGNTSFRNKLGKWYTIEDL